MDGNVKKQRLKKIYLHQTYIHIEVTEQREIKIKKVYRTTFKALVKGGTDNSFNVPSAFIHI
jgi:hypothetical protein